MSKAILREALARIVSARDATKQRIASDLDIAINGSRAALAADDAARGTLPPDLSDADIKAMYVAQHGSDDGWLGAAGSYFISGVQASRAAAPQSVEPVWYRWRYNGEWHSGPRPLFKEGVTHAEPLYAAPPTAPTEAEWQEEAIRLARECAHRLANEANWHRLRAHIATRPAPPTTKGAGA